MSRSPEGFYARLALAGFLLVPSALVVLLLALLALGGRPPRNVTLQLTMLSAACVLGTVLLRLSQRFLFACLALGVVLLVPTVAIGVDFGFRYPGSFFDFVTTLVTVVGPLLAVVGTSVALVQRRRGTVRGARPAERRAVWAGVAVFVLIAAVSAALTLSGGATADAPPGAVLVETKVDDFVPSTIPARAGETLRVFVVNRDAYAHTFSIDDLAVDVYIGPRSQRLLAFEVPTGSARELALACYVIGHEDMVGTLVVS